MLKKLLFFFLLCSFAVTACQPKTEETTSEVSQVDGAVSLSSEEAMEQPLDALFLSKNGTFSYKLKYDGGLMSLVETADTSNPYFEVDGGSTISMGTNWVAAVAQDAEMAGSPVTVGAYEVYQYMDSEGTCSLNETLIPYSEEVLRVTLKTCAGQDGDLGREALAQLLGNLEITAQ